VAFKSDNVLGHSIDVISKVNRGSDETDGLNIFKFSVNNFISKNVDAFKLLHEMNHEVLVRLILPVVIGVLNSIEFLLELKKLAVVIKELFE
jgi:hypothetical protein